MSETTVDLPTADSDVRERLEELLAQRIVVLDGAMGTMIQARKLEEADFRGERFADHDGDLDLLVGGEGPSRLYQQGGPASFVDVSESSGISAVSGVHSWSYGDLDRDGDVDLLVTANNGPVQLFENRAERPGGAQWIGLRLRQPGENAHAVGAHVTVQVGERRWARSLRAGTSYLAGNPLELHFGLGRVEGPAVIDVRWPDGVTTEHRIEALSRWITIERE